MGLHGAGLYRAKAAGLHRRRKSGARAPRKRRASGRVGARAAKRPRLVNRKRKTFRRKQDLTGTFVKCKDWKVKKFRKIGANSSRFARRVNAVVYSNIPRNTVLHTFNWELDQKGIAYGDLTTWAQFCLDPLHGGGTAFPTGRLSPLAVQNVNPSGITPFTYQGSTPGARTPAQPLAIKQQVDDVGVPDTILNPPNRQSYWRQGYSSMTIQMKNVKSYGFTVELFVVKPKGNIQAQYKDQGNWPPGWGDSTTTNFSMTPLELAQMGLARQIDSGQTTQTTHMWSSPQISLRDSPDFNERYRVVSKCKVYLPPGGLVERHFYNNRTRLLDTVHMNENLYDRRTTFVLLKYTAEPLLVNDLSDAGVMGGGIPVATTENASTVDIVGSLFYRTSFKQMLGNIAISQYDQSNKAVISANPTLGQATSVYATAK